MALPGLERAQTGYDENYTVILKSVGGGTYPESILKSVGGHIP